MPSQQEAMSRMETSTDSGIGRSGEISSAWSAAPTNTSPVDAAKPRGTIITLGGQTAESSFVAAHRNSIDVKRHSIAVDESKYVKDSKTLINLNGLTASKEWTANNVLDENNRRSKRVEFCKTEVHFAAESGRVNIVETDGKPPSTNNFRRRRRTSANSYLETTTEAITNGPPLMHFGDEKLITTPFTMPENEVKITVSEQSVTPASTITDEDDLMDEISLRGILKNKPIKPRPYHLGENLENSERLWGIRLKPVSSDIQTLKDSNRGKSNLGKNK